MCIKATRLYLKESDSKWIILMNILEDIFDYSNNKTPILKKAITF